MQYPKLLSVDAQPDYRLRLVYSNGEIRVYDFSKHFGHVYYKALSDPLCFAHVTVNDGQIEWATGQDFCPHTLYDNSMIL